MATFFGTEINDFQNTGWSVLHGAGGDDFLVSDQPGPVSIYGGAGMDFMYSTNAMSTADIHGGDGNDTIIGHYPDDALYGDEGNDVIAGADFYYPDPGGQITPYDPSGNDLIEGGAGQDALYGLDGNDVIRGGDGDDWGTIFAPTHTFWSTGETFTVQAGLFGGDGDDRLYGDAGSDLLVGGDGNDKQYGGTGDDVLYAGHGADKNHGGDGADTFAFDYVWESQKGRGRDVIKDFSKADHDAIGLYWMDANLNKNGDQAFDFIGDEAFHHRSGELRFDKHLLSGDTDGDGRADFVVKVAGVKSLHDHDFYL
ncbi:MAG TPA: calcium-binding protein [Bauldia sp.]|nr:calcium-binding protein [Bauldia sp.]